MSDRLQRGFALVGEEPAPEQAAEAPPDAQTRAAMRFWLLSMQNIGNRAVTGVSHLFTGAVIASAWALFMWTLPAPTTAQLVGLGLYGVFCLAVEWIRRARP